MRNLSPQSDQLDRPIHLLLSPDGRYLLIGSGGKDSILRHDLRQGSTSVFVEPKSAGLNGPAGMAFGDDGFFYVASRNSKEILRYGRIDGRPRGKPFIPFDQTFNTLLSELFCAASLTEVSGLMTSTSLVIISRSCIPPPRFLPLFFDSGEFIMFNLIGKLRNQQALKMRGPHT